jgi:RecB family endonuclease NucS
MPVKFGLWRLDGESAQQVRSNVIASEERLERIIQERLDILGLDDLFQIGRQVITDFGKRIDLLAIDGGGDLYVVELKRIGHHARSSPRHWSTGSGHRASRSRR